jgi:Ca2+-binding RTX toxin-like protein
MTTYAYQGLQAIFAPDPDNPTVLPSVLTTVYPNAVSSVSYSVVGTGPDGINLIDFDQEAYEARLGGQEPDADTTLVAADYTDNGQAKTTYLLGFVDAQSDTQFAYFIGGDPVPQFGSLQQAQDFLTGVTLANPAPGSGFGPGDSIPLAPAAVTVSEDDQVFGDPGARAYFMGPGEDLVRAGAGDDTVAGQAGSDRLFGQAGDDVLRGNALGDRLGGNAGADTVLGGGGEDRLFGGGGDDLVVGNLGEDTALGGPGDDVIRGLQADDVLRGGGGDDSVDGNAGDDRAFGNAGEDVLRGGAGNDVLAGQAGADIVSGGAGDDVIRGGALGDRLNGQKADDRVIGQAGDDTAKGGGGDDVVRGGGGDDDLTGNRGADTVQGGGGDDTVTGGGGADDLDGGRGDDVLNGLRGADSYIFAGDFGDDTIVNYRPAGSGAQGDRLVFVLGNGEAETDAQALAAMSQVGSDVVYDFGGDGLRTITIEDTNLGNLTGADFDFIA